MGELPIKVRDVGDVVILDLCDNLTICEDAATLHHTIRRLLDKRKTKILLNMAKVQWVDSSGLGTLVSMYVTITKAGGQVKLLHVKHNIQEVLAITDLSEIFDTYEDEWMALNDFQ